MVAMTKMKKKFFFAACTSASLLVSGSFAFGADVIDVPADGGDFAQCTSQGVPEECSGLSAAEYGDFLGFQFKAEVDGDYCGQAATDSFASSSFLSMYDPGKSYWFKRCWDWICGRKPGRPDLPDAPNRPDLPDGPNRPDLPDGPNRPDLPDGPNQKTCAMPQSCNMGPSDCEGFSDWGDDGLGNGGVFNERCTDELARHGGCIGALQASLVAGCSHFKAGDKKLTAAQALMHFGAKIAECRRCIKFYCQ